jgi:hypothetical protein
MSVTFADAIMALGLRSSYACDEGKIVEWDIGVKTGEEQPSEEQIAAKLVELQAAYDAQVYARSRKEEYDALNQFELMSDDSINDTTTHKDAILAIKAKYPKPE